LALSRPLAPGERLDPDRASLQELLRLPRVGPGLAKAIVADREAHGPFRSLQGLDRVAGVGPKLLGVLEPHLRFGGSLSAASLLTPTCPSGHAGCNTDLNAMTAAEFEALPGIGAALAARIVSYRESHGGFADIGALDAVPGIGPALLARLRPQLTPH
jgi:competence ComEA-like helix-hairpin-helix protein